MEPSTDRPTAEAVRAQLARILSSRGFMGSARLRRFLSYVVEQVLRGQTDNLKEYTIALEVFDRSPDYNPKVDAVVRVEARRLRAKLAEYYETANAADTVRIELPVGAYVPVFHSFDNQQQAIPDERKPQAPPAFSLRRFPLLLALGSGGGLAVIVWWLWLVGGKPEQSRAEVTRLIRDAASSRDAAVSPDGRLLAYASDGSGNFDIWIRRFHASEPLRVTRDEGTDSEPDISPDGSRIVFRSERLGGGIYLVSTFGGEERLLAKGGRSPRFSPDGKFVAYWVGSPYFATASSYLIPTEGGTPTKIADELPDARTPAWSPDGTKLLIETQHPKNESEFEYSLYDVQTKRSSSTGWRQAVSTTRLLPVRSKAAWDGKRLYFSALASPPLSGSFAGISQEVVNIWSIGLDVRSGKVQGPPQQVTYGASSERDPAISPLRQLIFTAVQYTMTAAYLQIRDSEKTLRPLFKSAGSYVSPFTPPTGSGVVALSDRSGQIDVWTRRTGGDEDRALTATTAVERYPILSHDGSIVYFGVREPEYATYRLSVNGGSPERICADCGMLSDIDPDSHFLLFEKARPYAGAVFDTRSRKASVILTHPGGAYLPRLSPDASWVAFQAPGPGPNLSIYVAPFAGQAPIPERKWVRITSGDTVDWAPAWSADGRSIYYLSDRDGSRCIWVQRVNGPEAPSATPTPLKHLHRGAEHIPTAVDPALFRLSATQDRVVLTYVQSTSSLFSARIP
jgi:eukaryotic-like serine/threonine-protein kinase